MGESEKSCLDGRLFLACVFFNSTAKQGQEIPAESLSGICHLIAFPS